MVMLIAVVVALNMFVTRHVLNDDRRIFNEKIA